MEMGHLSSMLDTANPYNSLQPYFISWFRQYAFGPIHDSK